MITNMGLKKLGFSEDDYVLQDDGDGVVYIAEWKSESAQPTKTQIETAHAQWQTEQDAKAYARARSDAYPSLADFAEAYTEKETAHAQWQTEQDAKAYARARSDAYPSLADFAEAYTEKEIGSSSTKWDAYVTAYNKVRSDNPKP